MSVLSSLVAYVGARIHDTFPQTHMISDLVQPEPKLAKKGRLVEVISRKLSVGQRDQDDNNVLKK